MGQTSKTDELHVGDIQLKLLCQKRYKKIYKIFLVDLKMKVSKVAETFGILAECVRNILHEQLCMTELCTRWCRVYYHWAKNSVERIFQSIV